MVIAIALIISAALLVANIIVVFRMGENEGVCNYNYVGEEKNENEQQNKDNQSSC